MFWRWVLIMITILLVMLMCLWMGYESGYDTGYYIGYNEALEDEEVGVDYGRKANKKDR